MQPQETLVSGAGALLFCAIFLGGSRVRPLRPLFQDMRSTISFGGGMCAAYVFVHVMPEVHEARRAFAESVSISLRYEGMAIYFLALVGFMTFYGLDHLRKNLRERGEPAEAGAAFGLHIGGFAAYVCLMGYLLVHNLEENSESIGLYIVAVAFHLLALNHSLHEEHGVAYERIGRFVLAGTSVAGWSAGLIFPLPRYVLALLVAFISGAIIMNSLIMELPSDKDGRFLPFMAGGLVYGLILMPFG
jgi:hypothetical protein